MNPVLTVPGPAEIPVKNTGGGRDVDSSFASHLDRRLDEKYGDRNDKLGVGPQREVRQEAGGKPSEAAAPPARKKSAAEEDAGTVADLLSQFMAELQEVAGQATGVPGEWQADLSGTEVLQQFAVNAGMSEADFSRFMQQFASGDNKINLEDFFAALTDYFQNAAEVAPVTVPEAEFPMLEAVLTKMGVSPETLEQLSAQAVTSDGVLDLEKLLQGLAEGAKTEGLVPVTLSDLEAEQLQKILAEAGLTLEKQNELLPERFLNQVLGEEAGQPVQLSLERLQNMLQNAVAAVRDSQPKVDLPAFLTDLRNIVAQSNFENQGVGWTPVVEESVTAMFQKLQEMADLARVKVENSQLAEGRLAEEKQLDDEFAEWVQGMEEKFGEAAGEEQGADWSAGGFGDGPGEEATLAESKAANQPAATPLPGRQGPQEAVPAAAAPRNEAARTPYRQLQQQVTQQLSDGVVRGLKGQEHHLVLRLYPQDLGEVKVNLTVRDEQVSVSFNMENSRVKEMLESNMEEFKESMKEKGFSLGECSVSVGQQDDNGEKWQRFEMARQTVRAIRETVADIPADSLYMQAAPSRTDGRQNGINLIV
jgi:flagellar hook-length control protein FliK